MGPAIAIALKDLRQRLRDRSALLIAFVVPLGLAWVLGMTIGNAASGDLTFTLGFLDEDRGAVARAFRTDVIAALEADGLLEPTVDVATRAEAEALAAGGDVDAVIVFPAGFSDSAVAGGEATLTVIANVDAPIGTQVAASIARTYTERLHAVQLAIASALTLSGSGLSGAGGDAALLALAERAQAIAPPAVLADVSADRRELDFRTFYAAGMSVFFLLFTVQFGVSSLVDERRDATLLRLLGAPIPRASILGGKILTSLVLGVASMTMLFVGTSLLLGAQWGHVGAVALLIGCGVLAATGITAITATFARTAEQAGSYQAIVAVVMGMFGGSFFPVDRGAAALAWLSRITPHSWFLRGLSEAQVGFQGALLPAAALLVIAAATSLVAMRRVGRLARP